MYLKRVMTAPISMETTFEDYTILINYYGEE